MTGGRLPFGPRHGRPLLRLGRSDPVDRQRLSARGDRPGGGPVLPRTGEKAALRREQNGQANA